MGKVRKNIRAEQRKQQKKLLKKERPFVSICTPTFNRRPFIPYIIKCYLQQDYPRDKLEWIIVDDGTDPIEDLVANIEGVKYFRFDQKVSLGKKRNFMHEKASGDIIVYMDDDDYYPPQRVSHAVDSLIMSRNALCAGTSELHTWFNDTKEMIQFGPYNMNHATAASFAFKRELLEITSYDESACLAEEKHFLKDYTIPFVQLNPRKTILVFSHDHNTFDKRKLLSSKDGKYVRDSQYKVEDFIKDDELRTFYTDMLKEELSKYDLGKPEHKPDVLKQTKELEERNNKKNNSTGIIVKDKEGNERELTKDEVLDTIHKYQEENVQMRTMISTLTGRIESQDKLILELQEQIMKLSSEKEDILSSQTNEDDQLKMKETIVFNLGE